MKQTFLIHYSETVNRFARVTADRLDLALARLAGDPVVMGHQVGYHENQISAVFVEQDDGTCPRVDPREILAALPPKKSFFAAPPIKEE